MEQKQEETLSIEEEMRGTLIDAALKLDRVCLVMTLVHRIASEAAEERPESGALITICAICEAARDVISEREFSRELLAEHDASVRAKQVRDLNLKPAEGDSHDN